MEPALPRYIYFLNGGLQEGTSVPGERGVIK